MFSWELRLFKFCKGLFPKGYISLAIPWLRLEYYQTVTIAEIRDTMNKKNLFHIGVAESE